MTEAMLAPWLVDTRSIYQTVANVYFKLGIGIFALFTVAIVATVIWFRVRSPSRPARWHEANRLELSYAVVLTCAAVVLLAVTFTAEHREDVAFAHERPALTIDVTASRWEWFFHYPRYGITHQSGAVGRQPLVVPINEPVRFELRSVDVIHSFWIPQLYFKRDAIPGAVEKIVLDFNRAGTFSGSCAEFCGLYHTEMVFTVRALSDRMFAAWAAGGGRSVA